MIKTVAENESQNHLEIEVDSYFELHNKLNSLAPTESLQTIRYTIRQPQHQISIHKTLRARFLTWLLIPVRGLKDYIENKYKEMVVTATQETSTRTPYPKYDFLPIHYDSCGEIPALDVNQFSVEQNNTPQYGNKRNARPQNNSAVNKKISSGN